jgi:transposase
MFDVKDDAKAGYRRVEVLTGPGRRRRWSAAEKARIVAETLVPGVRVSAVARRWQLCPQQVFAWRREARATAEMPPERADRGMPAFVPIVPQAVSAAPAGAAASAAAVIEIELAGAVVRVGAGLDGAVLSAVLRAVRSSASAA